MCYLYEVHENFFKLFFLYSSSSSFASNLKRAQVALLPLCTLWPNTSDLAWCILRFAFLLWSLFICLGYYLSQGASHGGRIGCWFWLANPDSGSQLWTGYRCLIELGCCNFTSSLCLTSEIQMGKVGALGIAWQSSQWLKGLWQFREQKQAVSASHGL